MSDDQDATKAFAFSENSLVSITQGKFVKGKLEGFGRITDSKGQTQIGFYSTKLSHEVRGGRPIEIGSSDNLVSRPFGKWMQLDKDMQEICPQGIYRGDEREWNRCVSKTEIEDFVENVEPALTGGQRFGDWLTGLFACTAPTPQMDHYANFQREILARQRQHRVKGPLTLKVAHAQLKQANEMFSKIDPYCQISYAGRHYHTLVHHEGGGHPIWNHTLELYVQDIGQAIEFRVMD